MPEGELVTVPRPSPLFVTVSVRSKGAQVELMQAKCPSAIYSGVFRLKTLGKA